VVVNTWPEGVTEEDVHDIVAGVAVAVARRYRRFVEVPDVRQELLMWAWRKRDKVHEYLAREPGANRRRGEAALMKALSRVAERYCRRMKAQATGYSTRDEFFYNRVLLEDLIAAQANGLSTLVGQTSEERVRGTQDPSEGGNTQAMLADIQSALGVLDPDSYAMVMMAYGDEVPTRVIGETFGITRQAVEQRLDRAMARVLSALGGESPW
jgi:RNA polymerase sigma factor (sigma-70 family)